MKILPIVERELRVAARRQGTYWHRAGAAALALVFFGWMFMVSGTDPNRELGQRLFIALSGCFVGTSLLAGVLYTADCLSEEKREGTLGLLFLTDLKGYEVVLGKLAASSLGAIYAVLAIVPVLAIPLLMGGVTAAEFGRVVLVLVNTLFFSLATGVLVSASMRHGLASMALTLLVVIAINLLLPLAGVVQALAMNQEPAEPWLIPSVGYAWALAHEPLYGTRPYTFLISLSVTHGLGWLFLVLASQKVRHTWQEGATTLRASIIARLAGWLRGTPELRRQWRAEAIDANPCTWLGGRLAYKAWIVWAGLGTLSALWLAAWIAWGNDWANEGVALLTVLAVHTLLRVWLAGEATLGLGPDRHSGALELILCTDLSVTEIIQGRAEALRRQFLGPTVFTLVMDLLLLSLAFGNADTREEIYGWLALYVVLMLVLVLDLMALLWLGLWWGLICRQPTRAVLRSLALIFVLPWILLVTGTTMAVIWLVEFPEPEWLSLPLGYLIVCGSVSLTARHWARTRLLSQLRTAAAGAPPGLGQDGFMQGRRQPARSR